MTKAQYFKTPNGEEFAILPRADYEALLDELEEASDVAAVKESMRAVAEGRDILLPGDVGFAIGRGENIVKVLRKWRGLTQEQLAEKTGLAKNYVSRIERGQAPGNKARKALAAALAVPETLLIDD